MCGERSSTVERQIVDLVAGGSSPLAHPTFYQADAPVAQLDRATDFESVGRRFESSRACSSSGKYRRVWIDQKNGGPLAQLAEQLTLNQ